jgi:hypothetical protein
MPNWKKVIVSGSDASLSTLTITNSGSTDDSLLLTATEDSSTAAPVVTFKRNSGTPADADYLGQLKFKGENDADEEVTYAKITAKILDASDGTEDGLIEFANRKAGSNVITARLRSDSFQLLNDTNLSVDGQISASSLISNNFSGSFQGDGSNLTGINASIISSSTVADSFTSATTHSVSHNLGTLSPFVQVYDSNNEIFIPTKIKVTNSDTVTVHMDPATSGRVTIADAGHIISGSADYSLLINTPSGIVSGAAQTVAHLPTNTVTGSAQVVSLLSGQNLTLGEVSASKLHTTVVSASIAFSSGSNIFGDELTDVHQVTGSLNVTGSANLTASLAVNHRDSSGLKFWAGSQAQYDALGSYDSNKLYFVT